MVEVGHDFDWSLCRVLLAVARRGSIAAATRELGISHPAVRRQLDRLEAALGAPLFSRSQSGMALTPLAVAVLADGEDMERAARSMLRKASSTEVLGLVRIAADGLLCAEVLPTVLRTLRADRPGLRYEIVAGHGDLLRGEADVGVHLAVPTQERLITSRIATFGIGMFAARSWIAANGEPADLGALNGSQALVGRMGVDDPLGTFGPNPMKGGVAVTVVDDALVLPLVEAGLGVGALPVAVAGRRDRLVRVLPDLSGEGGVWLSTHPDLRRVPHVRQVMDALRDLTPTLLA